MYLTDFFKELHITKSTNRSIILWFALIRAVQFNIIQSKVVYPFKIYYLCILESILKIFQNYFSLLTNGFSVIIYSLSILHIFIPILYRSVLPFLFECDTYMTFSCFTFINDKLTIVYGVWSIRWQIKHMISTPNIRLKQKVSVQYR